MKNLPLSFTQDEYKKLLKAKQTYAKNITWHEFIIRTCTKGVSVKHDKQT